MCPVGHSFAKRLLRERDGLFGGELAGHYYFREHFYCDSALMAALLVLGILTREARPLSELIAGDPPLPLLRGAQLPGGGQGPHHRRGARSLPGRQPQRAGRHPRGLPELVVQPAKVQHRAAAAPGGGGRHSQRELEERTAELKSPVPLPGPGYRGGMTSFQPG